MGAQAISRELGTKNHLVQISDTELLGLFERYLASLDQPTIDGFNTFLVAGKTAELGFKVALSGLGGDELFAGYPSFQAIPSALRVAGLLRGAGTFKHLMRLTGDVVKTRAVGKIAELMGRPVTLENLYSLRREVFLAPDRENLLGLVEGVDPLTGLSEDTLSLWREQCQGFSQDPINHVSALELTAYLRNMLLRDSDVFSMAHGLELRVPFLDHELVELLLSIPGDQKLERGKLKPLLVGSLADELPPSTLLDQKKGFCLPWRAWLTGPLKPMVEDLFHTKPLWQRLEMNDIAVLSIWRRFLTGDGRIQPSQILALLVIARYAQAGPVSVRH